MQRGNGYFMESYTEFRSEGIPYLPFVDPMCSISISISSKSSSDAGKCSQPSPCARCFDDVTRRGPGTATMLQPSAAPGLVWSSAVLGFALLLTAAYSAAALAFNKGYHATKCVPTMGADYCFYCSGKHVLSHEDQLNI